MKNKCLTCNKEFKIYPCTKNISKYCSRKCFGESITKFRNGEKAFNWKGGIKKAGNGYVYTYQPLHPNKVQGNYILEHRLVMEKHIGRYLSKNEVVHHINGIKDDNRIENLQIFQNNSDHLKETSKYSNKTRQPSYHKAKITKEQVIEIRCLYKNTNMTQKQISKIFNVTRENISSIIKNKTWKNI